MLEGNAAQGGGQQTATPPPEVMDTESFINDIVAARGGAPVNDEMDPHMRALTENQFKTDTELMLIRREKALREISPDATETDLQNFLRAMVQDDPLAAWKAAGNSYRKQAEKEENEEDDEELRVEGAGGGSSRGDERAPIRSMTDAALSISDSYR